MTTMTFVFDSLIIDAYPFVYPYFISRIICDANKISTLVWISVLPREYTIEGKEIVLCYADILACLFGADDGSFNQIEGPKTN